MRINRFAPYLEMEFNLGINEAKVVQNWSSKCIAIYCDTFI